MEVIDIKSEIIGVRIEQEEALAGILRQEAEHRMHHDLR